MNKLSNKLSVINYIRENDKTDRQTISKSMGINVSTSKRIVDDLVAEGIVTYLGENESTGGRKSTKLGINYNYGLNLVIKIEVDKIILSLTDFEPKVLNHMECDFEKGSSLDDIIPLLKESITKNIIEANSMSSSLFSIGIAVSGVVSRDSRTLISSTLLGWENVNFSDIVEEWFKIPTYLENDVNCAVIAEHWFGQGKGLESFILLTLGEGTGAGIILNNKLFKGSFGGAGEIGHSIFEKNGKQCYCGQKGCLEMYTNEDYLKDLLSTRNLDEAKLKEMYDENPKQVQSILDEFSDNVLSGIINLIVVLEPQRILIGGEMSYVYKYVQDNIISKVNDNWINSIHSNSKVDVLKSNLGPDSFIKGLAVKLISKVIEKQF